EVLENFRAKPLTNEQILISIDRLTRFKPTEEKYLRVFKDIIISNLVYPKYKRQELDNMDYEQLTKLADYVFELSLGNAKSLDINKKLEVYENSVFKLDVNSKRLLDNNINYEEAIKLIDENSPINLRWLKSLESSDNLSEMRQLHALRFPVKKLVICEGLTEEILLPEFAKLLGYDFDCNGVYVLSAGGKNQVVKLFYKMVDLLNIPVFVLLDSDALENSHEIETKLRPIDKIYLLKSGEFEDILPVDLVEKTLIYATENISLPAVECIEKGHTVEFLEDFFKHRGLHEFKKAEFAEMVKENLSSTAEVSEEIKSVIKAIELL
uniref:TOPRIM nucleotidyl transferase/hydrolase domain-containing protein n=1 Tax=Candidatus Scatousia sp. TaxID=3085663 RepID=UPI0040287BC5